MQKPLFSAALFALVATACNAGPEPKNASSPPSVPIYNTAAVIENIHAITEVDPSPNVLLLLRSLDRDPRDVALDARFQAPELLSFFDLHSGEKVGQLTAGGGYLTELFARAVGPNGLVLANLPPSLASNTTMETALDERLERPVNGCVTLVHRELGSPLPEAHDLDLVYLSLPYRTAVRLGVDMKTADRAVFDALKPGGRFVLLDYRPRMNGPSRVNLHALHDEESTSVRRQVEAAGFHFVTEARFLRNDPKTDEWDAIAAPNPTGLEEQDRFLLEFAK
jgi:predicted methyltransferase